MDFKVLNAKEKMLNAEAIKNSSEIFPDIAFLKDTKIY